ncbi:MAG: dTDP-glucose 4,6-dehydratase [Muribaculaceae bacterium]|nr:dTDP-glucose 4,6-dehydratase [Muribaculaceae bacterium]
MSTREKETFLVAGGAGFIGVNFVKYLLAHRSARVLVLDALTYAGNASSLAEEMENGSIDFFRADIADYDAVESILRNERPQYIVNFAAETHVDRSVDDPRPFIDTNVVGAYTMLECARRMRDEEVRQGVVPSLKKFVQISTDEVYGDLSIDFDQPVCGRYGHESFKETTPLRPSSPYSASKTSADVLALSYYRTFGFPVVVTRCSNNYGPYQFPEKLIPLMINNLLENRELPVYGRGLNVRDWIYVDDHCRGVLAAALDGKPGEVYNFGGLSEKRNIDIVKLLIKMVAEAVGNNPEYRALAVAPDSITEELITYVGDRPGHDLRYAIDPAKARRELGWKPEVSFEEGMAATVAWYLANRDWVKSIVEGSYRDYYKKMYSDR